MGKGLLQSDSSDRASTGTQWPGRHLPFWVTFLRAAEALSSWKNCSALDLLSFHIVLARSHLGPSGARCVLIL